MKPIVGGLSPWGQIQHVMPLARGIVRIETAGHGGYFVPPEVVALLPEGLRDTAPWFEEDCEAKKIDAAFAVELWPARDPAEVRRDAVRILDRFVPECSAAIPAEWREARHVGA